MTTTNKALTLEQIDQIHEIQCHLSTIADLMAPSDDLHIVNRDNLSMLVGYFSEQLRKVIQGAA
jgi:hypothetical protein